MKGKLLLRQGTVFRVNLLNEKETTSIVRLVRFIIMKLLYQERSFTVERLP